MIFPARPEVARSLKRSTGPRQRRCSPGDRPPFSSCTANATRAGPTVPHAKVLFRSGERSTETSQGRYEQCVSRALSPDYSVIATDLMSPHSKDIMVQNIDSILARGERIELLVDKTDTMANQAHAFRRGARGASGTCFCSIHWLVKPYFWVTM